MFLYRIITKLFLPFLMIFFVYRLVNKRETFTSIAEKITVLQKKRPEGKLIWLHAVSVGEVNIVINIIYKFLESRNDYIFLVTTSTLSSAELFKKKRIRNTIHQFMPIDDSFIVSKFLKHWRPEKVVFIESELWPGIINAVSNCAEIYLLNARMSNVSFKRWFFFKNFAAEILGKFSCIAASSKIDFHYYKILSPQNTFFLGNLKYAAPPLDFNEKYLNLMREKLSKKKIWLSVSTHPGEEEKIIKTHKLLKKKISNLFTIIIPRHHRRIRYVQGLLKQKNINYISQIDEFNINSEMMLVGEIGVLGNFFRLTDVVFVGGSLVDSGGHNIIEPAKLSCAVLMGYSYYNFIDVTNYFISNESIIIVEDEEDLFHQLLNVFSNEKLKNKLISNASKSSHKYNKLIGEVINIIDKETI